jgi:hypothetical protein
MEKKRIRVLKDTPFNKKGDIINFTEFRSKYNYLCARDVTDEDLIAYLKEEKKLNDSYKFNLALTDWFKLEEEEEEIKLPFVFSIGKTFYSKNHDLSYRIWNSKEHMVGYLSGTSTDRNLGTLPKQAAKELIKVLILTIENNENTSEISLSAMYN